MAISTHFNYAFVCLTIIINLIATAKTEAGCDDIRNIYQRKGFSLKDVPNAAKPPGEHMGTCGTGFSCCTTAMEYKLTESAGEEFEGNLYEASYLVRDSFVSKSEKFDNYFIELLDKSDRDFSAMFQHTYGNLYNDNKGVFDVLYSDLRDFYHGRIDDLENALDDFFANVLQKMYALLNPGEYSDDFMVCIAEHLDDLKPFGSIPETLTTQMGRSLNAARTYVQGLDVAQDIVTKATKESPVSECKSALMKMEYCQSCKGISSRPAPCDGLCTNIMKACLAQQAEIAEEWIKFTDSMLKLGERMSASFNIETVIDSINVKVSEGIMNYQENSGHVSQKVAEECGQHMRKRRSSGSKKKKKSKKKEDWSRYRPQGNKQQSVALGATLSSYILESNEMLNGARDFWTNLPYLMCNDDGYAAEISNQNCWTGVETGNYENDVVESGLAHQMNNPEVDMLSTNTKKRQAIIDYKSLLKDITSQLNQAYSGKDTTFIIIDDEDYGGSGSGSGSGSGDIPTDLEKDLTITTIDNDPKYRPTKFPDSGATANITWTLSVLFFSVLFSCLFRSQ